MHRFPSASAASVSATISNAADGDSGRPIILLLLLFIPDKAPSTPAHCARFISMSSSSQPSVQLTSNHYPFIRPSCVCDPNPRVALALSHYHPTPVVLLVVVVAMLLPPPQQVSCAPLRILVLAWARIFHLRSHLVSGLATTANSWLAGCPVLLIPTLEWGEDNKDNEG